MTSEGRGHQIDPICKSKSIVPYQPKTEEFLSHDEILDRVRFMIETGREIWNKYKIDKS